MIKYQYHSPLGTMTMLASDKALHGLWFNGQKHFGAGFTLDEIATAQNSITKHTAAWLDRYLPTSVRFRWPWKPRLIGSAF